MTRVLTGVGGGILRDLLLDISPPYSTQHWENMTVALAVGLGTVFANVIIRLNTSVLVLDGSRWSWVRCWPPRCGWRP